MATEILLSSYQITRNKTGITYEFILDQELKVTECVKLVSATGGIIQPIQNTKRILEGVLFELSHVRVNPQLDNSYMIELLTNALYQIGVKITNQPHYTSMAICYKPLGEISDSVRFYLNKEGKLVFLSPATKPRLVYSRPKA